MHTCFMFCVSFEFFWLAFCASQAQRGCGTVTSSVTEECMCQDWMELADLDFSFPRDFCKPRKAPCDMIGKGRKETVTVEVNLLSLCHWSLWWAVLC